MLGACSFSGCTELAVSEAPPTRSLLEKCKTLRGEPELIMSSAAHESLKFLGAKWNLLNN